MSPFCHLILHMLIFAKEINLSDLNDIKSVNLHTYTHIHTYAL